MSNNQWLATFKVGEKRYVETSPDRYASDMRTINTPLSRRTGIVANMRFTTKLFTAVSAGKLGDIRHLICVERIK